VLKQIHEAAAKAKDTSFVSLCSFASIAVIKVLNGIEKDVTIQVSKKRKTDETPMVEKSDIVGVYISSLSDFMTKNKSKIKPKLFLELCVRYPAYARELLPELVNLLGRESNPKAYPLIQGYNLMSKIIQQSPIQVI
jgi:hypothetical protein